MRLTALSVVFVSIAVAAPRPAFGEVTAEQVRQAIERGIIFLKRQQKEGHWAEVPQYPGGVTALCTLALLMAGVPPEDPAVAQALEYLKKIPPEKTYVVSLQTMVFCRADPEKFRPLIERNVRWLEQHQIQGDPETTGAWGYPARKGDNSNTQFAILALNEAERVGISVNPRTWRLAKAYWERVQNADGSWGYREGLYGTGSMTAAGIASLVITSNRAGEPDAQVSGGQIVCCQSASSGNSRIRQALQWLGNHFAVTHNPGTPSAWMLYYLYGLERVGRLTAVRFIGEHDWYREGAEHLLRIKGTGADHWIGIGPYETDPRIATAFALMFLSKGRWPILMAKLKHGADDDWNAHRHDVANLTFYVERRWRQDMVWQTIDLEKARVEDLLEAPVLYFCGRDNPLPADSNRQQQLAKKLRGYLDRGGFLLAEGYCGAAQFDEGFRRLMQLVFPEPEYRLEPLPPDHPVWRAEQQVDARFVRPLWGINYGCRTSVIYCPPELSGKVRPSLSCLWELSRPGRDTQYPANVQAQIDAGLATGINILAYATGRQLRYKDPAHPRPIDESQRQPARFALQIGLVRHPGGCNAAPRALTQLAETVDRQLHWQIQPTAEPVDILDPALFDYPVLWMHGRNSFYFTDAERNQLKTYLERGGVIVANAICGSKAFTEAFRREMREILPNQPLLPLPPDHPLFSDQYGGFDLRSVSLRIGGQRGQNASVSQTTPKLEAITWDDRLVVIFSPYDISCALEQHDSLECNGYLRDDALRLAINILLYVLQE